MQDTFGIRLMKAQNRKGMKSNLLAVELDCNPSTVAHMRMDKHTSSIDMLRRICKTLEVSADFLLGLSDKPEIK